MANEERKAGSKLPAFSTDSRPDNDLVPVAVDGKENTHLLVESGPKVAQIESRVHEIKLVREQGVTRNTPDEDLEEE